MTDNVERMRKDALGHFADASQWDMAPEDTINWQRGLNANNAADEIETLRQQVKELKEALAGTRDSVASWVADNEKMISGMEEELVALKQEQGEPVAILRVFMTTHDMGQSLAPNPPFKAATASTLLHAKSLPIGNYTLYTSAPTIPEGYVLVPVEATYEMREAVRLATESEGLTTTAWQRNAICAAMLSAATEPKEKRNE